MVSLYKLSKGDEVELWRTLDAAGWTREDLQKLKGNIALARELRLAVLVQERVARELLGCENQNPYAISLEEQMKRFLRMSNAMGWGFDQEDIRARLFDTAPDWPEGRDCFRSLRIRFGNGRDGVGETFEKHIAAIRHAYGPMQFPYAEEPALYLKHRRNDDRETIDILRLYEGTNSHEPIVEWVLIDLSANQQRKNLAAACSDRSIADEGLVLTWMFPERIWNINRDRFPPFYLGGYVVEDSREPWSNLFIDWCPDELRVCPVLESISDDDRDNSVPVLLDS